MKLSNPVKMVETDQAGFHVSGWKSLMDRHSLCAGRRRGREGQRASEGVRKGRLEGMTREG